MSSLTLKSRFVIKFLIFFYFFLASSHVFAQSQTVKFVPEKFIAGSQLELKGIGVKRIFLIKAFVAAFYFDKDASLNNPLEDVAKQIEVQYFVSIPGKKLSDFTIDSMKDNISQDDFKNIQKEIAQMYEYFVDLRPGDKFSLIYIPEIGTKFVYNDEIIGVIQGELFARALFSTWLGDKPFDASIKRQILNANFDTGSEEIALSVQNSKGEI